MMYSMTATRSTDFRHSNLSASSLPCGSLATTAVAHAPQEELRQYNGEDETKPILLGFRGNVYDVTRGARHYGPVRLALDRLQSH